VSDKCDNNQLAVATKVKAATATGSDKSPKTINWWLAGEKLAK